jgi:hypothetical protein
LKDAELGMGRKVMVAQAEAAAVDADTLADASVRVDGEVNNLQKSNFSWQPKRLSSYRSVSLFVPPLSLYVSSRRYWYYIIWYSSYSADLDMPTHLAHMRCMLQC